MSDRDPGHDDPGHDHSAHGDTGHDADAGGHGHDADPHAGVVRGTPPTPAWLLTSALIGLVTVIAAVLLAVALNDAIPSTAPHELDVEGETVPSDGAVPGGAAEPTAESEH